MKVYAINGSPRVNKNTVTVLDHALRGAGSLGFETEMVHLYKLKFTGCISCFSCKLINGKSYGKCIISDGLTPVLEKIQDADAIIFGSPIYLFNISSGMSAFLERFLFPNIIYNKDNYTKYQKKLPHAFIYTMNDTTELMKEHGTDKYLVGSQKHPEMVFQVPTDILFINNTYQFTDYSKYESSAFNESDKLTYRENNFPVDCENAFALGKKLAEDAIQLNNQANC